MSITQEIKQALAGVETGNLHFIEEGFVHNDWQGLHNSRFCIVYSVINGKPIGTPAFCAGEQTEAGAIREAIERIKAKAGAKTLEG